jgi:signal transduction histidine kinase
VGTLIAFQGKERKFGYIFSGIILLVALTLIMADLHYPSGLPVSRLTGISYDLLYNIVGAAIATFTEVAYILAVNNRLNESLIKTNQELDNFVYIVSHDLRSPLMLTKGLLDISKRKIEDKNEVLKYMDLAGKSINNLDDIIKEILTYSRNARTGLQHEQFDLKTIIQEIYEGLDSAECPEFTLLEDYKNPTIIITDKGRLHTILRNLITNSFKYRKKEITNPFVKIIYTRNEKQLTITIEDNGQGIAEESLGKVYDMFYRGTSSTSGTGLGLYICKEMLLKMGASFRLESSLGMGTRFSFTLREPS